jgi:uncharacterized protein (UPF0147 family)
MYQSKFFKLVNLTACSLVLLSACQTSSNAGSAVESYLESLRNNQEQKDLRCIVKDAFPDKNTPNKLRKWEIVSQEEKIDERDPDSQYVEVLAKIESMSLAGFPVTQTWKFTVWKSDELFEHQKRFIAKAHKLTVNIRKTTNEINAALGKPIDTSTPSLDAPDRSEITSKPYCITTFDTQGN